MVSRRDFLITAVSAGAALGSGVVFAQNKTQPPSEPAQSPAKVSGFTLPPLPYAYDALEPHIDAKTMELHHSKHHKAAVDRLNAAIARSPKLSSTPLPKLLAGVGRLPKDVQGDIRNQGGSHANHTMFWEIMAPNGGGEPKGEIAKAINASFGSFDAFKKSFNETGSKHFGSGWVFVVPGLSGRALEIISRPNQDSPLLKGRRAVFGNDLWEHAYYLKHNNRRDEYLAGWWNVLNWEAINARYEAIRSGDNVV